MPHGGRAEAEPSPLFCELWKARWRSPAGGSSRGASPCACDAFPCELLSPPVCHTCARRHLFLTSSWRPLTSARRMLWQELRGAAGSSARCGESDHESQSAPSRAPFSHCSCETFFARCSSKSNHYSRLAPSRAPLSCRQFNNTSQRFLFGTHAVTSNEDIDIYKTAMPSWRLARVWALPARAHSP